MHHRPRPHALVEYPACARLELWLKSLTAWRKGEQDWRHEGPLVGHRVQFWLGLALAHPLHLLCFRRRRSLFLASRLSHLSSEAVNASGSVRVRVSGRLQNTHALPQTCRWVPSDCLLHFPNHHPLHCTHPEPSPVTHRGRAPLPLEFDLHTSSTPFYISLSTSAQPSPVLPKLRSTPSMRQPRSRDPTTTA